MKSVVTQQEREQLYREMGWWQDERLESRYERLSAVRLNKLAVADNHGRQLTHGQLLQAAKELRHELSSHGINKGDRILIVLPNRVEWQIALLAILQLQAIPASIPVTTDDQTPFLGHECAHVSDATPDDNIHPLHGDAAAGTCIAFDHQQSAMRGSACILGSIAGYPHRS